MIRLNVIKCLFFVWVDYVPVNNFAVMLKCFLGGTSAKYRLNCFAQRHNTEPQVKSLYLKWSTLPLSHCTPQLFV